MKKLIIIYLFIFYSEALANPVVVSIVKEGIKKAPKIIKVLAPLLPISDLMAEEVKEKMSKEKLDLLKINF
jgi:hypothetical protein